MKNFASFDDLKAACLDLPTGSPVAAAAVASREVRLTKPAGALGRLEEIVSWLAYWQGKNPPRLDRIEVLVFAGNHGVTAQGVSAYPAEVTAQMVANFAAGGAAINQLARAAGASLRVIALVLDTPTADFTLAPAMDEPAFLAAVTEGYEAVSADADLICLGEMGIGNTTSAAALAAALFGGGDRCGARASRGSAWRPAEGGGGAGRARTCRGSRRDACRAPHAHPGADRRFRRHRRGRPASEAARRYARPCAGRPCLGGSRPPRAARCARQEAAARSFVSSRGPNA
jgi:hypothetical protein